MLIATVNLLWHCIYLILARLLWLFLLVVTFRLRVFFLLGSAKGACLSPASLQLRGQGWQGTDEVKDGRDSQRLEEEARRTGAGMGHGVRVG